MAHRASIGHWQPAVQPPPESQQPLGQQEPSLHSCPEHELPELLELLELLELELELLVSPLDAPLELEPLVAPLLEALASQPSPDESHASGQQTVPHAVG